MAGSRRHLLVVPRCAPASVGVAAAGALGLALAACGGSPGSGDDTQQDAGTTALFSLSAGSGTTIGSAAGDDDFYAMPYPNDLRRHGDGTLDLSRFPTNSLIVDQYRQVAEQLDGFGLNAAMFARFSAAIDPATLPDAAGSMGSGASVYVVDVTPTSPDYNTRTPLIVHFVADAGNTIGGNRIAVRPYPGFPLDEATTYALVVTTRVHDTGGAPVTPSADFTATLQGDPAYAPLRTWLASGDAADTTADVASAAVFTTQHATFIAPAIRQAIFAAPAPVAANIAAGGANVLYRTYTGTYTAPNFQSGDVPYTTDGGEISVGSDGAAVVQRAEPMRFALTIPDAPMPAGGFPFAVYAHGTGGDYESFIDDGTANRLATQGIAVISTDQVLHGPRNPGGDPEISFFNFGNPYAARDNALQGAADAWSQLRLIEGMSLTDTDPNTSATRTVTFDATRAMFFGHSQGGLTGPPFVAYEPTLKGAVLSGTGAILYLAMLYKTQPIDIPALIGTFLRDNPVDEDNPSLALLQTWVERADAGNYAPLMVRHPPGGEAPRNIFQSEGFTDTYAPNPSLEAFATALGGDIVQTADTMPVEGVTLRGRSIVPAPVSNNLNGATAVLAQYTMAPGSDGHFVVFEIPAAEKQSSQFLGTLAATGTATVVTP